MKKKHTLFCCTTLTFLTPTALSDDDQPIVADIFGDDIRMRIFC